MRRYSYLLFDVDDTLLDFKRAEHNAMVDTLKEHGFGKDEAHIERIITTYSPINAAHWKMLERGEIDRATLLWKRFEVMGEQCELSPMDARAFAASYCENLAHKSYLLDGALEVCTALAKHYTLCAITNGNAKVQHGRFDPSPIYPLFTKTFISEEIGVDKPAPAFFAQVKEALPALDVTRTLVIGDSLTSDIAGGIAWGADTCWICPEEEKRGDATARGLSPTYIIAHLRELMDILL